jgi:hypothetical protein
MALIVRCDTCKNEVGNGLKFMLIQEMQVGEEAVYTAQNAIKIHLCMPCYNFMIGRIKEDGQKCA